MSFTASGVDLAQWRHSLGVKQDLSLFFFFFLNLYIYFTLVNGDVCFDAERDSNQDCCHNNITVSVTLCLSKTTLLVLSFNLIDSLFSEIVLINRGLFCMSMRHR